MSSGEERPSTAHIGSKGQELRSLTAAAKVPAQFPARFVAGEAFEDCGCRLPGVHNYNGNHTHHPSCDISGHFFVNVLGSGLQCFLGFGTLGAKHASTNVWNQNLERLLTCQVAQHQEPGNVDALCWTCHVVLLNITKGAALPGLEGVWLLP